MACSTAWFRWPTKRDRRSAKGSPEPPADLQQIRSLLRDEELITSANSGPAELEPRFKADGGFFPVAPRTFAEAHVSESHVETIILRLLSLRGALKGVEIAQQIFFPFSLAEKVLQALKTQRLVAHKNAGTLSDFIYELTEAGANKIRQNNAQSTYCGSVPVSLNDYSASVAAQSLSKLEPQLDDLRRAFADMTLSEEMFRPPRAGHRVRQGALPLRATGQRQDEHRRADHGRLRHERSGSRGRSASGAKSSASTIPAATRNCPWPRRTDHRRRKSGPPLGPHPPADDRRRRRADDGEPGHHDRQGDRACPKRRCK